MKLLCLVAAATLIICGCTKPAPGAALTPIQSAGCAVETDVAMAASESVAATLNCTQQQAIQASLLLAFGNVNMCATPLPASPVAAAPAIAGAKVAPKWAALGDVSAGDLSGAKSSSAKALVAKPFGIVGSIACPIVVNVVLGFATSEIPAAWGCSANAGAATVGSALTAACLAAVPL